MDREPMRMAILNQEQIFRQQVHELHQLYHVQKQLMQQAQTTTRASHAPAPVVDVKPRPQQLDIWCGETATTTPRQQIISFTSCNKATTPAPTALAEECNLELTLATGPSSSSSNSSCHAERRQGKRLKASSNSDSGTTAVSSTSTDSELAQFREVDVATPVRFHGEVGRRMDEMGQGPWMYQCLSLKMA
ncbi:uncharacterized protein [Miscanthus floridulus]|uniref:uncharacterized protein n=1 Tax=Miscanthus floridulus TaxID=154761 RepID=UPI003458E601